MESIAQRSSHHRKVEALKTSEPFKLYLIALPNLARARRPHLLRQIQLPKDRAFSLTCELSVIAVKIIGRGTPLFVQPLRLTRARKTANLPRHKLEIFAAT